MENITTFEQSRKLKLAGFPQPNMTISRYQYTTLGGLFNGFGNRIGNGDKLSILDVTPDTPEGPFAALTAFDFMREHPGDFELYYDSRSGKTTFCAIRRHYSGNVVGRFFSDNPAEACAEAYFGKIL